jgi:hypothetical protein
VAFYNISLAEEFCREYISTSFIHETLCALLWLHTEKLASISHEDIQIIVTKVREFMSMDFPDIASISNLIDLIEFLGKRVVELSNISKTGTFKGTVFSRDDLLVLLSKGLRAMKWIQRKKIFFLLDDYSPTILPDLAIKAYNPVLFRKSNHFKIKISSEGDGPTFTDSLGRIYREGRDFVRVNLGEIYFDHSDSQCTQYLENILDARFGETKVGSLDDLKTILGRHEHSSNFGRYICEQARPGLTRFYGFDVICRLCSGDVSYLIELLDEIVRGRWDDRVQPETAFEQDKKIKKYSRRQLDSLRSTPEYGPVLHAFAEKVGNLLKTYLLTSSNPNSPDERLRIEIEGEGDLSPEGKIIHSELLKHSVLIPGGGGKSRGGLPTRKYYFRRLYAPCFPFSPNRGECIALTWSEYNLWLKDPSQINKKKPNQSKMINLELFD